VKKTPIALALVALILLLPFLGGSAIWYLGGAHGLDVDGVATPVGRPDQPPDVGNDWSYYGGDPGGQRFSTAADITVANAATLELAWEYRSGDLISRAELMHRAATEGTPILVGDSLVFCTPFNEVIALDPADGTERWRFDPGVDPDLRPANQFVCRGVSHWQDAEQQSTCSTRIFMGTNDARLIAIDARDGRRCEAFGNNGEVRVNPGMELWWPGEFQITSPPAIIGDTVVIGSAISDNARVAAPKGSVLAYNARTGEPRWDFDPIVRDQTDFAKANWQGAGAPIEGHANVWAPMSVDTQRGLVFLPTSSPSPDFYGGLRPGDNRYADSVVALDGQTGAVRWSFQTVHHDIWDYDVPAQPGLYSVWRDGAAHDVVAQVTKTGLVFVLDRGTGEPFLPIEERTVPQGAIDGESLSPTQPFPVLTPPIVPSAIAAEDAFGITCSCSVPTISSRCARFTTTRRCHRSKALHTESNGQRCCRPSGGVVFIGATMDHYLRAFDVSNGEELWRGRLSAPAMATPMTYAWQGKQYVVVYAGGNARSGTALSDQLIAFALPAAHQAR
jgi:quinoprotein glucose dehydrogenase